MPPLVYVIINNVCAYTLLIKPLPDNAFFTRAKRSSRLLRAAANELTYRSADKPILQRKAAGILYTPTPRPNLEP